MWNFKGTLWNSTQNILPIYWKIWLLYNIEIVRALRFKSSYAFLKCPLRLPVTKLHLKDNSRTKFTSWWHYDIEMLSALLTHCDGDSPVTGSFPSQRSYLMWRFNFSTVHGNLDKMLNVQLSFWLFETPGSLFPSHSLRPSDAYFHQ